ncbi:DNA polymerase beta superfamily protein [Sphingosinithalassobacter portus]|uniref:nucleotidyltransferase domain-containing protein n=1 Tax=Stakelama portus TaxID=2676234 RepID=UPI00137B8C06|nr:nucleotidyltransferase domain-containing protein [Sphingosinithalassobacter portus]
MSAATGNPIAPVIRQEIEARLTAIEASEEVRILLAVESGSRAWGFPSPDSDYDVRFIYVRPRDWYLSLAPGRDVIERPIVDEIDCNGWDIRKALGLLLKSNAVVGEWIDSPIRYRLDDPVVAKLTALADAMFDPRATAHHYANLARGALDRWFDGASDAPVKRYFYALRPALAIRTMRVHPGVRPPMNLQALVAASELKGTLVAQIDALVAAKARSNEKSNATRLPEIDALIRDELGRVNELPARTDGEDFAARADTLFLDLVNT